MGVSKTSIFVIFVQRVYGNVVIAGVWLDISRIARAPTKAFFHRDLFTENYQQNRQCAQSVLRNDKREIHLLYRVLNISMVVKKQNEEAKGRPEVDL